VPEQELVSRSPDRLRRLRRLQWQSGRVSRWNFEVSEEAADYLDCIRDDMIASSGLTAAEASGRVARFWELTPLVSPEALEVLRSETPAFWARTIYYGQYSDWWLYEACSLEPLP
jgi:hypothetical protein